MIERDRLVQLCQEGLLRRALTDPRYQARFEEEMKEIDAQAEYEYFLDLYDKGARFDSNEHNLIVAYLLGLVDEFDIEQEPAYMQGEFPDIDMDYLPVVRDYLKNEWAPKTFGRDKVCSIGTYGTLGIKMALKDMTRVHGIPRDEIELIAKKIPDKDDDGHELEWDKALALVPELKDYCDRYPDIADAVQVLLERNKSGGVHAGGLIISSVPIADFVPLEVRSVTKDNKFGVICSAWGEGLRTQDLGPVGLVKFDLLVVDGIRQIALATNLIKMRHGIDKICALPGQLNWSDTSYLNDRKALDIAAKGDTKNIFQFGSEGIRKLLKSGGVDCFHDLAAYSALYRPGPMGMGMHERYVNRKKGAEKYSLHPLMRPILGYTYGVMAYQEQVMQILNRVGGIPLIHCEKIRKAISKKKVAQFVNWKSMFLKNGQKNLGCSEEFVQELWDQIEAFADYGFNKSHSYAYSFISSRQLWLMAHYPLEFYTACLMCKTDSAEIKAIKIDAEQHGIELAQIDINNSEINFAIKPSEDGKERVFFGFSNLKKIGETPAQKIVEHQPYSGVSDFIERYGTDGTVIKALISLGVFCEPEERLKYYKFVEYWKDWHKKRHDMRERFKDAMERYDNDLKELLQEYSYLVGNNDLDKMGSFTEEAYELWEKYFSDTEEEQQYNYKGEVRTRKITVLKHFHEVKRKREQSIKNNHSKEQLGEESPPSLESFNPNHCKVKIGEDIEALMTSDPRNAEKEYYGWQWEHDLERCEDYKGYTFEWLQANIEGKSGVVEIQLKEITPTTSKKGKKYYILSVEDANGQEEKVTIWPDDFERFKDELQPGNLMKMRVVPPEGNWTKYGFEAPPPHQRWTLPKNKFQDCRLALMSLPVVETPKPPAGEETTLAEDVAFLLEDL